MRIRKINLETYWKMENSFFKKTNYYNPYKKFFSKLQSDSDEELNSLTIKQWDEYSIEIEPEKEFDKKGIDFLDEDYINFCKYKSSMNIAYPSFIFNTSNIISFILILTGQIKEEQKQDVRNFIIETYLQMQESIKTEASYKNKVNLKNGKIKFDDKYIWIIKILESFSLFGYKIIIKNGKYIILPFWDWTFDMICQAVNELLRKKNFEVHGFLLELILNNSINKWNPDQTFLNYEYSVNTKKGEIDYAFVKNEILYVFEFKNIDEMANPIDKNFKIYKKWEKQYFKKGMKQLNFIKNNYINIFNKEFKKVIPIYCTFSRNRKEPCNIPIKNSMEDIVFLDLDSLLMIVNLEFGYELILEMSYHNKNKIRLGIFDFVDWIGVISGFGIKNMIKEQDSGKLNFDMDFLKKLYYKISIIPHNNENGITMKWNGNYSPVILPLYKFSLNKNFIFGNGIVNSLAGASNHQILKIIKFIYEDDAFFDKSTRELTWIHGNISVIIP